MTRHVILRSPAANKRQPLLASESKESMTPPITNSPLNMKTSAVPVMGERRKKVGEVAGGAAAECAAVWCCCPCAVVNLVVLAVYRVPAAVCRKAWRRRKLRCFSVKRKGLLAAAEGSEVSGRVRWNGEDPTAEIVFDVEETKGEENDVVNLEKEQEMWDHFYGAGFWRSPSQRDT